MGPLIPLCHISGDVSPGFQSQSGQPYSRLVCEYIDFLRFTSGTTPADLLAKLDQFKNSERCDITDGSSV